MTEPRKPPVLLLTPFVADPLEHGAVVRTHHLGRHLARTHEVWLVCRAGGQPGRWGFARRIFLNPPPRWRQLLNPGLAWTVAREFRRAAPGPIVVSHLWSALLGITLQLLTGSRLVFDNHNAEYIRFRRQGSPLWPLIASLEWLTCRLADQVICVSATDAELLARGLGVPAAKLQVIPNGADVTALQRRREASPEAGAALPGGQGPVLLFFGTLLHRPNREAVDIIRREIAPRLASRGKAVRIVVAGAGGHAYADRHRQTLPPNMDFTDFVADIVPLIQAADLVIVPLTAGSGTRLKIIESLACGRRVVSTTVGAEGLDRAACGDALQVADGWDAFTDRILAGLAQPRETTPSPAFVAAYDWSGILAALRLEAS